MRSNLTDIDNYRIAIIKKKRERNERGRVSPSKYPLSKKLKRGYAL